MASSKDQTSQHHKNRPAPPLKLKDEWVNISTHFDHLNLTKDQCWLQYPQPHGLVFIDKDKLEPLKHGEKDPDFHKRGMKYVEKHRPEGSGYDWPVASGSVHAHQHEDEEHKDHHHKDHEDRFHHYKLWRIMFEGFPIY